MTVDRTLITMLVVLLLTAGATAHAAGSKGATGIFSGEIAHPPREGEKPLTTAIVLRIDKIGEVRRITTLSAHVHTFCATTMRDIRIVKSGFKGPKLKAGGTFTYKGQGATIKGRVGAGIAQGTVNAASGDCTVTGATWSAKRS